MASKTKNPSFYIYANSGGCPQNQLDGAQLANYLDRNGYSWAKGPAEADLIIINGCAYKLQKQTESIQAAQDLSRIAKKGARIVISGCLPKIAPEATAALNMHHAVIPGSDLSRIEDLIYPEFATWNQCAVNRIPAPLFQYVKPFRRYLGRGITFLRDHAPREIRRHCDRLLMYDHSSQSYVVRIAEGCLGICTYCADRFSRGPLHSKPSEVVVDEVNKGVCSGADEILLTATDLAAYGRDIGTNLAELLATILRLAGDFDLLLFYANPRWLMDIWDQLEPIFATGRIHFIHLSLNGGSEAVLERMQRGYTLLEFEKLINRLRLTSPDTVLQTQVIVGFPGETESDFAETRSFFQRTYFHNVQVHAFDARPRTLAADMPEQIPFAVRNKRRKILYRQTLLDKMRFNLKYLWIASWPRRGTT